ncbi:MAG TPA: tetratricopeptide repeat protein, partial [bacterium]|nr:tetratricopeptide repeat protein [bacterium]
MNRRIIITMLIGLILLGQSTSVWAVQGKLKEALASYEAQEYSSALAHFVTLAEEGSSEAQYHVGRMYLLGQGVGKDLKISASWYQKAANQGNAKAQNDLGVMYLRGIGVPQDYKKGFEWIGQAANAGLIDAQFSMGLLYAEGKGVRKNLQQAASWFEQAAKQG